ncbi:unnamed protein product [Ranitomeya imitator]|uniref:Uncharacterized protein n=1 Tax=Ranitomeya imitator TaxID=111125 RepID=A0ABN9MFN8_9NEOB|nr:unnamed protein product [Ranitomeya imitator]
MGIAVRSGASHLHQMTSSSCLHIATLAQAYFVCPVEGRAKYCSAQAPGLSDRSRHLRTAVLCSALNRADKVCLHRNCGIKIRRGRDRKKMGGPGPDRDAHRIRLPAHHRTHLLHHVLVLPPPLTHFVFCIYISSVYCDSGCFSVIVSWGEVSVSPVVEVGDQ